MSSSIAPYTEKMASPEGLRELYRTKADANLVLRLGKLELPVHKEVLAAASPWFKEEFSTEYLEHAIEMSLNFREELQHRAGEAALENAAQFMYTGDYDFGFAPVNVQAQAEGVFQAQVWTCWVGFYFEIDGLEDLAAARIRKVFREKENLLEPKWLFCFLHRVASELENDRDINDHSVNKVLFELFKLKMNKLEEDEDWEGYWAGLAKPSPLGPELIRRQMAEKKKLEIEKKTAEEELERMKKERELEKIEREVELAIGSLALGPLPASRKRQRIEV
ncbi:hypothetical protein BCR34DRAFT_583109 [Clohesyomyces aquaticus]|uniref:BTB domain-containing protein n=1 Tax=Clohesyomyces aquaticus TaxID=1231657 RepID=A0A1Y2A6Q4_9PLEO|nr:hypothetical protein BCR34DRAFT_583109 [Clohesyomyces aquaticus]